MRHRNPQDDNTQDGSPSRFLDEFNVYQFKPDVIRNFFILQLNVIFYRLIFKINF